MNEQVKWYIERALQTFKFEYAGIEDADSVLEHPIGYGDVLLKALELAVIDVG